MAWLGFISFCILFQISIRPSDAHLQTHILHEQRDEPRRGFIERRRAHSNRILPMRISLKQNEFATEQAEEWLRIVSDPSSPDFAKFWTSDAVVDAFKPADSSIRDVLGWLALHGITNYTHSDNKMWIAFDVPAKKAEEMFWTEYYEHKTSLGDHHDISCDQYHLPLHIHPHVDFIKPGVTSIQMKAAPYDDRQFEKIESGHPNTRKIKRNILQPLERALSVSPNINSLENCDVRVTPACIRALYNFSMADPTLPVSPDNGMGIWLFSDYYYQPDLDKFFTKWTEIPNGTSPVFKPIDGAHNPPTKPHSPFIFWEASISEADLDVQMAIPIVYPQNVTVYESSYVIDGYTKFLEAIDGSYCKKVYHSSAEKVQCGIYKAPYVISYSFGDEEIYLPFRHQRKLCNEFLKLALQGTSIFFASGDSGAGPCFESDRVFIPEFGSTCPYVTSVGGTTIPKGNGVHEPEIALNGTYLKSGGGFSLIFDRPSYQEQAVHNYLRIANVSYPYFFDGKYQNSTGRYNRNGRAYPDLAAVGNKIVVSRAGNFTLEAGTSASTPIVAALFNRIIEERLRIGKGPLGLINPTLYRHPEAFNDITIGGSHPCNSSGFSCAVGWDPVTGLGTPNYGKLLEVFLALP